MKTQVKLLCNSLINQNVKIIEKLIKKLQFRNILTLFI